MTNKTALASIQEAAKILNVSTKTLRRWESRGVLVPVRTDGGHRRYDLAEVKALKGNKRHIRLSPTYSNVQLPVAPKLEAKDIPVLYNALHVDQKKILKLFAGLAASTVIVFATVKFAPPTVNIVRTRVLGLQATNENGKTNDDSEKKLGAVLAAEDSNIRPTFNISIESIFKDNTTFQKDVEIDGDLTLKKRIIGNVDLTGVVIVGGTSISSPQSTFDLLDDNVTTLNIGGDATDLNLGAATGNTTVNNNLVVDGTANVTGAATVGGLLTANGDLSVGGNSAVTGNSTVGGTQTVTGKITGSGDLAISGNASFGNITSIKGITYSFPTAQGGSDTYLRNDGAGTLTWIVPSLSSFSGTLPIGSGGTNNSTAYTAGSVIFSDGTKLTQDNANFFYDNTNNRLGIGNSAPTVALDVTGAGTFSSTLTASNGLTMTSGALNLTSTSGTANLNSNTTSGNAFSFTDTSLSAASSNLASFTFQNANTGAGVIVNGIAVSASGATPSSGANTENLINLSATALGSNTFNGIYFDTGLSNYVNSANWTVTAAGAQTMASNLGVNGGSITTTQSTANIFNANATTLNIGGDATTINMGAGTGTTNILGGVALGDGATDNLTFNGRVAQDSDLLPITTTGTNDLGSALLPWDNIYGVNIYQNGNAVCDASGANCPTGSTQYWSQANGVLYPMSSNVDVLIGGSATGSAKVAFKNITAGTPTATISGSTSNVATYLDGNGNLATTNMADLTLGSSTTGNVTINSRGSTALTANGSNLSTTGTFTLPNTNTLTGVAGYTQVSGGVSVGGATTYYLDGSGNLNANAGTFAGNVAVNGGDLTTTQTTANLFTNATTLGIAAASGTTTINNSLMVNGNSTLGDATTDTLTFTARVAQDNDLIPIGTTGVNDLGSNTLPWDNVYAVNLYQNGNAVCDSTGANCPSGATQYFGQANGIVYPLANSVDMVIGATSTSSAKFAFKNVLTGTPTATIAGSVADVATYLDGNGNLSTTNAYDLTLGSATSGNVILNSRGSQALIANGANLTAGGTITLPNSNTISGVANYIQSSTGYSVGGATTYYFNSSGDINANAGTFAGAFTANGDSTLGNAITDNITFTGRVAQDNDLVPITATGTNDLGSASLPWDNVYAVAFTQNGNAVCDASGANCPAAGSGGSKWRLTSGAISPFSDSLDVLIGGSATSSARVAFTNILTGTPTATISGSTTNVATYLDGNGNLSTTNMANLTLGSASTGNITLTSRGISALTANGANLTTTGTFTLPNSNTVTGVTNYSQFSGGVSVGDATTYYLDGSGNLNGNAGTFAGTLTANGNAQIGNAITDTIDFQGRVAQDSDLTPIGTTGTNDLGTNLLPWDNIYGVSIYQNGNLVCDASGANCPAAGSGGSKWKLASGAISPFSDTLDVLIGNSATTSAKFAFKNVASGTPTATISGSTTNVATYLDGNGNLSTTNMADLTLGSATTGNIVLTSRGSAALTANGANLTTTGTITLPNSNTLTGVSNYLQASAGLAVGGATTYYFDNSGNINANAGTFAGTFTANGNTQLGNATGDTIDFQGRVAQDSDLTPIGTTGTNDLGTASLPWDNIYGVSIYQNGNLVCDSSGANCPGAGSGGSKWRLTSGSLSPFTDSLDVIIGSTATTSAKFAFKNVASGTPTATISGSTANVATYLDGNGNLSTTNMSDLTLGSATTGNVVISSRGSSALTANGANLTTTGTLTLPNTNTLTGVSNYLQTSAGLSVGGATTYYFDGSGNLNANAGTFAGTLTANGNVQFGNAITDTIDFQGRVAQDSDLLPIGTTGTNDLGSASLPWDNIYGNSIYQNGNLVCDASGANCPVAGSGGSKWTLGNGVINPFSTTLDVLVGGTSTASAKIGLINSISGVPTATIAGTTTNVATYLNGNGNLSTTNMADLTLGSATTGNVVISSRGSSALTANGANLTTTGTFTLPNSNTLTGLSNYLQASAGLSVGGATTYYFDASGNINANAGTFAGTLTANGNVQIGNAITDTIDFQGRVAQDSDLLPIGTTGTNDLGSASLPWDNVYAVAFNQNGNLVCDASGANCPAAGSGGSKWSLGTGSINPFSTTLDVLVGGTSTSSAKIGLINSISGVPTATIAGTTTNVATYINGNGNLSTTNMADLTLGSSTTGNVVLSSRGSTALTANGANLTASGTLTLPNSNTITGAASYAQFSNGVSVGGATTYYLDGSGNLNANAGTFAGTLTANGNTQIGNAITDTIDFQGRVAQDSDLLPIGTTGTNDLGSASLPWDNVYATVFTQNGNLVCDASGANCPSAGSGGSKWKLANGTVSPFSDTLDVLIGNSATTSAKFAFKNVASGTPTASISGSTTNVATYLDGNGNLSTTNMADLNLGSATTGNVVLSSRGSTALTANGANLTASGTLTIPNSNTITGVTNYSQFSGGVSVGGATTYYFDTSGNLNANAGTFAGALTANGNTQIGNAITDTIDFQGRVAQDSDLLPIGTTGTNDLGSASLPWDNVYATVFTQNGNLVCDASGTNCPTAANGGSKWKLANGAISPFSDTLDVLIGNSATSSAKFAFKNVASGVPTASISGTTTNVATFLDGEGNLSTTNMANLTLGGSTTGNVVLSSRGSTALTANGANLTASGTITVPNSNTISGVANYLQLNNGIAVGGSTNYYFDLNGNLNGNAGTFAGALTANGNSQLGNAITDTIDFQGRVAQDSDLLPIGTTGTNDLGSASLPWDNVYATVFTQNGNLVCDASGANCPSAGSGGSKWRFLSGAISPFTDSIDVLIGSTATTSAKFAFKNVASGTPTASISGSTTNVATYLDGNGNLSTTNMADLTLGSATTGNVVLTSRGSAALTANGANLTTTGTVTLPSSNTLTGVSNYTQFSNGVSVGNATTYYLDGSGNLNANAGTFAGALTANGNAQLGNAITDTIDFQGRVAQDSDLLPIGTTGTNDLGSASLPWDNVYAVAFTQNGNSVCDTSGNCSTIGNYWQLNNKIVSPSNTTYDLAVGGTATGSAFQVFGIEQAGRGVAKINSTVTTTGNVIEATASALTSGNLVKLGTGGSNGNFTGNGIYMDFDNTGGNSFTGNFLKFDNAGATQFSVDASGNVTTTGTTITASSLATLTTAASLSLGSTSTLTLGGNSTVNGGTGSGGTLTLVSTTNGTKGNIQFFSSSNSIDSSGNLTIAGDLTVNGNDINSAGSGTGTIFNSGVTTLNIGGAATTIGIGAATGTTTIANSLVVNGDATLGNAITDNITFSGRVAQDNDLVPIGTTGTNDLGTTLLPWDNIYADAIYQNGNAVCDASGANCPAAGSGGSKWRLTSGAISPFSDTLDVLIGSSATASAKFAFKNVASGTPTASISGSTTNVATYLDGNGNLSTTNMADLTLGSATTGNVVLTSRGSAALTANGANLTTTGTLTLPNTNTLTGVASYLQASAGLSVGGATTYHFDSSGNLVANDLSSAGNTTIGDAITDTITFNGRVAQDIDLLPIGTTGTNDLGSASLPWDNVYAVAFTQNGNSVCDTSGNCSTIGNYWQLNNKIVSPGNSTYDLAIGGTATGSAFQVFGIEQAGRGVAKVNSTVTTTGNVIEATASALTSGNLVKLGTGGSNGNFTGNGIYMDFDNTGGNSFTGNFLKFDNAASTKFTVDSSGNVGVAASSGIDTITAGQLNIGTTNANAVSISKSGTTTTVNGALTSTQTLTASNGLTLTTGALNLTSTSGTSNLTSTATSGDSFAFTNNSLDTASSNLANFTVKNNNTAGAGLSVSGVNINGTGSAPLSGTNTTNLINLSATALANNTFNGINFGNGLTNYINGTNFTVTSAGNVAALGGMTVSGGAINLNTTGTSSTSVGNGTGSVALTLGSDATGDIFYRNSGGNLARLAVGTEGQTLTVASGLPSWSGAGSSGTIGWWQLNNKIVSPANSTYDLTIGGTATGSAFQAFGIEKASGNIAKLNSSVITTGNVFEATASAITSGNIIKLGTGGSNGNFTGNGIYMDFDNTGGNSFTGNFAKFDNAGSTMFTVDSTGDVAVNGGDITTTATTATLFNTNATTLSLGGAATTALNIGNGTGNYTAINLGSGAGTHTINIAGTGATAADTINIGTGGTGADTINVGSSASSTALNLTSGTGAQTFSSAVATTTGTSGAFAFAANSLTTGTGLYLNSSTITTGDLMLLNNSGNTLTSGNLFNVQNNSSSVFSIGASQITAALPTQFTAAGDVTFANDIMLSNQTASSVKSKGPLTIDAGESFESNNLTLTTYNSGNILLNTGSTAGTVGIGAGITPIGLLTVDASGTNAIGKAALVINQDESQDLLTASASGTTKFRLTSAGNIDSEGSASISGNLTFKSGAATIQSTATSSLTIGGSTTGNITLDPLNHVAGGYVAPNTTNVSDLGTASLLWRNIYATTFNQNGNTVCDSSGNCPSGGAWTQGSGIVYPNSSISDVLVGGTATASAKFKFMNVATGTPTASVSGSTANVSSYLTGNGNLATTNMADLTLGGSTTGNVVINSRGNAALTANGIDLTAGGDLAVNGGDITTSQTTATIFNTTATTLSLGGAATTALNLGNGTGNYTAINIGSGAGTHTINLAGTGATAADTINIGTGGTAADTINIGSSASSTALNLTSGTGAQTFTSSVATTTGTSGAFAFTANSLTTGTGMYLSSSSITTGDLMLLNAAGTTLTSGHILDVQYNSSSVFSVGANQITSALPHQFTAAGDVTMAYDLVFTNQTASIIDSYGPLTVRAGESFESNNLTLKSYNSGNIVFDQDVNGKVLIGTGSATLKFTVSDSQSATAAAMIENTYNGSNADGLAIKLGYTGNGATTNRFITFLNGVGNTVGRVEATTGLGVAYQTAGVDFAEYFTKSVSTSFDEGEIVSLKNTAADKSNSENDPAMIGIVSTSPGFKGGNEGPDKVLVGLVGQVPLKISSSSEPIKIGDLITSSSDTGRGKKSTKPGFIIGKALEDWNGQDTILVYVSPTWADPNMSLTASGNIKMSDDVLNPGYKKLTDENGNTVEKLSGLTGLITNAFNAVQGTVDNLLVKAGLISPEVLTRDIKPLAGDKNINVTVGNATESGKLAVKDASGTEVATIDSEGNATFSGQVNAASASIDGALYASTIYADQIISKEGKFGDTSTNTLGGIDRQQIEDLLSSVEQSQELLTQASNWSVNTSTSSAMLNELNLKDLYVTGIAALDSLNVQNSIIVGGELAISKLVNGTDTLMTIDSLDSPLSIQSSASQPLYIMAGKVKVDTAGNMQVLGNLAVGGVLSASAISIAEDPNASTSATINGNELYSLATAGQATVASGSSEIKLINPNIKPESLIFVTPTSQTAETLFVKGKEAGSAIIGFLNPAGGDTTFNWWIVNLINGGVVQ